jgi:hypothetical protein
VLIPEFTAPSYGDRTLNDVQRCVNWHPEKTPEGWQIVTDPGLALAYTITGNEPSRGWHKASNGTVYSVHGNKLYELSTVSATDRGTLSTSSGKVYFADDGTTLLISAPSTSYTMPFATNVMASISDANFVGEGFPVTCIDGYFVSTDGSDFYLSALGDPADWTPVVSDAPDPRGGSLEFLHATSDNLILFQRKNIERWYNTGNVDFTFERITGSTISLGMPDVAQSFAARGQTFYFQSQGDGVEPGIYEMGPAGLKKISTPFIDGKSLGALSAFCYELDGHAVYQINFALTSFCYDIAGGYWWEKSSNISGSYSKNQLLAIINRNAGTSPLGLDSENGNVYLVSIGANDEAGTAIQRIRDFGPIGDGTTLIRHDRIEILLEADHDSSASYTLSGVLTWSDNGGLTFSSGITLSKAITSGTTGQLVRLYANRLGSSRKRIYRWTMTGPAARLVLKTCDLALQGGRH